MESGAEFTQIVTRRMKRFAASNHGSGPDVVEEQKIFDKAARELAVRNGIRSMLSLLKR